MLLCAPQCLHVTGARSEQPFGLGVPAGQREQPAAQLVEAGAGSRRQRDCAITRHAAKSIAAQVGLVVDVHEPRVGSRQALGDARIAGLVARLAEARQVVQEEHRVGTLDLGPGACNADALDFVMRLHVVAQPCSVDHVQRNTFDLDRLAQLVPRGARDRRDDRQFGAGQRVEQRALPHVGLTGDHDPDPFAQQRALARALQHGSQGSGDGSQALARVGLLQEVDLFLGKVERRLDERTQCDEFVAQRAHLARECAAQ